MHRRYTPLICVETNTGHRAETKAAPIQQDLTADDLNWYGTHGLSAIATIRIPAHQRVNNRPNGSMHHEKKRRLY